MKHYKKLNKYKASNVEFCLETKQAYSYGWWKFVSLLDDNKTILFNNYSYSPSTSRHQRKVSILMRKLNILDQYNVIQVSSHMSIGKEGFYVSCVDSIKTEIEYLETILQSNRRKLSLDADRYSRLSELNKRVLELESIKNLIAGA